MGGDVEIGRLPKGRDPRLRTRAGDPLTTCFGRVDSALNDRVGLADKLARLGQRNRRIIMPQAHITALALL